MRFAAIIGGTIHLIIVLAIVFTTKGIEDIWIILILDLPITWLLRGVLETGGSFIFLMIYYCVLGSLMYAAIGAAFGWILDKVDNL